MKAGELRAVDMKLLRATLASNGGGVNVNNGYSEATRIRLMKAGLIQWKPNDKSSFASMVTITPAGRARLQQDDSVAK